MSTTAIIQPAIDRIAEDLREQVDEDLREQLVVDFARACRELDAAQRQQAAKDTPAHRAAVAAGRAAVDALLDMYLDLYPHTGGAR